MLKWIQRPPFQVAVALDHKRWLRQESSQSVSGGLRTSGGKFAPPLVRKQVMFGSFNVANELEDLHRVWAELLGELILNGLGIGHEARFVDIFDNLDAHRLELCGRIRLKLEARSEG